MAVSDEMRRLDRKWSGGTGWPKRLEWIELRGMRGWTGQRIEFPFPIVAIVGENGSGKSTLLQAAASVYRTGARPGKRRTRFASDFFPDTAWDKLRNVEVKYGYQEGAEKKEYSIRKPTTRWLGNVERPEREVEYIDLSRIQPVSARVGYNKIATTRHKEKSATAFGETQVKQLSGVMGREYESARMALSILDDHRRVPVVTKKQAEYSGFHQGSGELVIMELLNVALPKYGLVLIDEIESSLHPRAQRRLIRYLAERCRDAELQIVLTTHSPYVLEELPLGARMYILENDNQKKIMPGVSPQFAMTKMDDEAHPECDLYVEDDAARIMLEELLAFHAKEIFIRCSIVPFGASNVGYALGQMIVGNRFRRPTRVFVDGDAEETTGCVRLPGGDAPERIVFKALKERNWLNLWSRLARDVSLVADACTTAMTLSDHHDWVRVAANALMCGGEPLWRGMCAEWTKLVPADEARRIVQPIEDALG